MTFQKRLKETRQARNISIRRLCSDLKIQKSTYENWESRELWQAHIGNQHLQDYMAATEGAVEEFTLNEKTHIP